jgi:hypothetical protein
MVFRRDEADRGWNVEEMRQAGMECTSRRAKQAGDEM